MTMENMTTSPKPRSWRFLLIVVLLSIVVGLTLASWGLSRSEMARRWLFGAPPQLQAPLPGPAAAGAPHGENPVGTLVAPTDAPIMDHDAGRLASLEARMAKVESSATHGGDTGRAEGLLIAFAARRALEKGMALGYIEGELNRQFGSSQPRAVAMIIAAAHQPVTRDSLGGELDILAPQLGGTPASRSWWDSLKQGMGSLIIVRPAGTPSPDPVLRVAHARELVGLGRVDQALAEVARLPNRDVAAHWIADARRFIEAQRALDLLEAAAIIPQANGPKPESAPSVTGPEAASPPDRGETF